MTCSTCGKPMAEGRLRCMACGTMHNQPARRPVHNPPVHNPPPHRLPAHTLPRRHAAVPGGPMHGGPKYNAPGPRDNFTVPAAARPSTPGLIPGERVRSVQSIAWTAIALVCVDILMDLGVLAGFGFAGVTASAGTTIALRLLALIISFASFVVIIVWLWRCRSNLEAFEHTDPRWRPGWCFGAWFIPIANLILIPFVIADVARNSARQETDANRAVVAVWVWGLGEAIGTVTYALNRGESELVGVPSPAWYPEAVAAMSPTTVTLSLVLLLVTAAAEIAFLKAITDLQQERIGPGGRRSHRY